MTAKSKLNDIFDITDMSDLPKGLIPQKYQYCLSERLVKLLKEADYPLMNTQLTAAYYRKYTKQPEKAISCKKITAVLYSLFKKGKIRCISHCTYIHTEFSGIIPEDMQFPTDNLNKKRQQNIKDALKKTGQGVMGYEAQ
jgi:hypothetical protein